MVSCPSWMCIPRASCLPCHSLYAMDHRRAEDPSRHLVWDQHSSAGKAYQSFTFNWLDHSWSTPIYPFVHDLYSKKHSPDHPKIKLIYSDYHIYPRSSNFSDHSALHPLFTQRSISPATPHPRSRKSVPLYTNQYNVRSQIDT
jgi:hypothetical protein